MIMDNVRVINLLTAFAFSIILLYDYCKITNEVYELNTLIESHVGKMKHQSVVGMYIQTPHVKNPAEALYTLFENLFYVWFICVASTFLYVLKLFTLPTLFFRPYRIFI